MIPLINSFSLQIPPRMHKPYQSGSGLKMTCQALHLLPKPLIPFGEKSIFWVKIHFLDKKSILSKITVFGSKTHFWQNMKNWVKSPFWWKRQFWGKNGIFEMFVFKCIIDNKLCIIFAQNVISSYSNLNLVISVQNCDILCIVLFQLIIMFIIISASYLIIIIDQIIMILWSFCSWVTIWVLIRHCTVTWDSMMICALYELERRLTNGPSVLAPIA